MPTRTIPYLIQTEPRSASPGTVLDQGVFRFNLGRVAAAGIKELLQTTSTGGPLSALIEALLTDANGGPLVWRENGPGVGWEMKNAWSGIFGRFFARAFLEAQGYSWFHPIRRSYDWVADDLYVQRISGEIADWVCASNPTTARHGNFIVAEAKGRHREGTLDIATLPRCLGDALEQIRNTRVWFRRSGQSSHSARRTKAYAILTRWTNEEKAPKEAILRAVDPETPGDRWEATELLHVIDQLKRAHLSELLGGLGFQGLALVSEPKKQPWNLDQMLRIIESARRSVLSEERLAGGDSESTTAVNFLLNELKKQEKALRRFTPPERTRAIDRLKRDAEAPQALARIELNGIGSERFIGSIYGLNGQVTLPLRAALASLRRLPRELMHHFTFVGIRVLAVEQAIGGHPVEEWKIDPAVERAAEDDDIYPSLDSVIVAPASRVRLAGQTRFL